MNFFLLLPILFLQSDSALPPSPCPEVFRYESIAMANTWYGVITLKADVPLHGVWLNVILDNRAEILANWIGEVTTTDNQNFKIENTTIKLQPNEPLFVNLFVKYPPMTSPPLLETIIFNGIEICKINPKINFRNSFDDITTAVTDLTVPPSACASVFRIANITDQGTVKKWFGIVKLQPETTLYGLWLNIVLDMKADILANWIGEVTTEDNIKYKIENTSATLIADEPVYIPFIIKYSTTEVPNVMSILFNGKEICSVVPATTTTPKTTTEATTTIATTIPTTTRTTTNRMQIFDEAERLKTRFGINKELCGFADERLTGQWPWQIALYMREILMFHREYHYEYICEGTLVTQYHVLTVAHCVTERHSTNVLDVEQLAANMGRFVEVKKLNNYFLVEKIKVHPGYEPLSYSKNLAVLQLGHSVVARRVVTPVCLWPKEEIDLHNIVGRMGLVAGWPNIANKSKKESPKLEYMVVVDQETCINSYQGFYKMYSDPEFTYCAGFTPGTEVCTGDSGTGMVFNHNNTWYMRGLVSVSVARPDVYRCNPRHYVVFTDLAKFLPWIQQQIKT